MKYKGFTLIELMIVVAIIGILFAIAIPNFMAFQCRHTAQELNLDKELSEQLCKQCENCENISPKDALVEIANGNASFEDFIGSYEQSVSNTNKESKDLDTSSSERIKKLEARIKELEGQLDSSSSNQEVQNLGQDSWKD